MYIWFILMIRMAHKEERFMYFNYQEAQNSLKYFPSSEKIYVCSGKEWYRFPSHFFFPSKKFQLGFIESGFNGQLPKPFSEVNSTWAIHPDFNDLNKQEMSRYV